MQAEHEGVIKFELIYRQDTALPAAVIASLNSWRRILFLLRLVGQDPRRYAGLGYGNISQRLTGVGAGAFAITGTQTGGLAQLRPQHYATVLECDPARNRVVAQGPVKPSSECLTHATLYALDDRIQCVMHVHSAGIWRHAVQLKIPATDAGVAYGTPAMAREVQSIYPQVAADGLFVMAGHQDGVVAFGDSVAQAGHRLLDCLARALVWQSDDAPT